MELAVICLVALGASALTLFSGFGLGTLLMPAFALFFPVPVAVAQTAVVHLANNLFKLGLFWRRADRRLALAFGLPALLASLAGAELLLWLSGLPPLFQYDLAGRVRAVTPVKLLAALLMAAFALWELVGKGAKTSGRHLVAGGLLSGFFGGLSGNQGAFRSAFLVNTGLDKEAFIGTGVLIAVLVDASRLSVYAGLLSGAAVRDNAALMAAATLAAFCGAFVGRRLVRKVTIRAMQALVAAMLVGIALLLGSGLI